MFNSQSVAVSVQNYCNLFWGEGCKSSLLYDTLPYMTKIKLLNSKELHNIFFIIFGSFNNISNYCTSGASTITFDNAVLLKISVKLAKKNKNK